jgi:hypothetical protein
MTTTAARPTSFNALLVRRLLDREDWAAPTPFGPNGWLFNHLNGNGSIVMTCHTHDDGDEWIHASIAWADHMPTYTDLTLLHRAVFGDRWAYQIFAPTAEHVNIHNYALHLWGRHDGKPGLPNFTQGVGTI